MAEDEAKAGEEVKAKRKSFRKFSYRGVELAQLLDLKTDELVELLHSRGRRKYVEPPSSRSRFVAATAARARLRRRRAPRAGASAAVAGRGPGTRVAAPC